MSLPEAARTHQEERARIATLAARSATTTWDRIDPEMIPESWGTLAHAAVAATTVAQRAAAQAADSYLDTVAPGLPAAGRVAPAAYAGVASDGRPLESLLLTPISPVLSAIATGNPVPLALTTGRLMLELLVRTMVADAGRAADTTAMAARRDITGYVRVVEVGACARCIVLAGREYEFDAGFLRHPRCQCTQAPLYHSNRLTRAITPSDPQEIFEAMSPAEQDRVFGKDGAEAIRLGADIDQVVNARRGMDTATVFGRTTRVTTEGTTVRGVAARRMGGPTARLGRRYRELTTPRLMPEQILADAEDREDAIRLLRRFGYLAGVDEDERRRDDETPVELTRTAPEREPDDGADAEPARDQDAEPEREPEAPEPAPEPSAERAEPLQGDDVDRAVPSWNDDHFDGDTQAAFESYKDFLYQSINERLRTGEINPADTEDVEDWIARMRAGFDALPATTESILVHRGVPDIDALFGPPGSRIGGIFRDKAFVSTTTDVTFAEELGAFSGNPSVINILVPAGSKALRLDTGDDDQEFEILLPDDSRFRVVDDRIEDGKRIVDLELLPDGDDTEDDRDQREDRQDEQRTEPEPESDVLGEPEPAEEDDDDLARSAEGQAEPEPVEVDERMPESEPELPGETLADLVPDFSKERFLDEDAARRFLRDNVNGTYAGFEVVLADVSGNAYLQADFTIRDANGAVVGIATRRFQLDDDGDLVATHVLLDLREQVEGQGFASAFNAHLEDALYRPAGFDRIATHADIDVGGYAWARAGFDWSPTHPGHAERCLERLEAELGKLRRTSGDDRTAAEIEAAEALLDRARRSKFGDDDYPTPYELSQVGRQPGDAGRDATWIGKRAMLGSDWQGVKWL